MKILKIIASFLLIFSIIALIVWSGVEAKKQKCTEISIVVHAAENSELLTESDVLNILKRHNLEWEGKLIEDIKQPEIKKILEKEEYVSSVDKVHFSGTKLQIEISLFHILLEVQPNQGENFLIDVDGNYLPYSPKGGSDVIVTTGNIPPRSDLPSVHHTEHSGLFHLAQLIKDDPFYEALFREMEVNSKREIVLKPTVGNLPVLLGNVQNVEQKLKTLKYMYEEVLPYVDNDKYTLLDARFQNRIIAKTKT